MKARSTWSFYEKNLKTKKYLSEMTFLSFLWLQIKKLELFNFKLKKYIYYNNIGPFYFSSYYSW